MEKYDCVPCCEGPCCCTPIMEKFNKDNLLNVISSHDHTVLHKETLGVYKVHGDGLMKESNGNWVKCIHYHPIKTWETNYTRTIESFIDNFIPLNLKPFETRLLDEKHELNNKLTACYNFIYNDTEFTKLDNKDRELLEKQYASMKLYFDFLEQRVTKMLKQKIEEYDALPSTGEEVKANVAEPANVL